MVEPIIAPNERLLRALAEQLKLPLLQIARQSELAMAQGQATTMEPLRDIAVMALQLVDSFLLSSELHAQEHLALEPVSLSSVLFESAQHLGPLARQYNVNLEVRLSGKYGPVMAHKPSLQAAMITLGYAFLETGLPAAEAQPLVLGAHRCAQGIVAGLYSPEVNLSPDMFRRARALYGTSRQPLQAALTSAGAGVFVADSLLNLMSTQLRVAKHDKLAGLAATFLPSKQLQLV